MNRKWDGTFFWPGVAGVMFVWQAVSLALRKMFL